MSQRVRYNLLDALRGLAVVSMTAYHAAYDIVAIYGVFAPWYFDTPGYLWQQSICWSFIILSGMCWSFGKSPFRKGLLISACGMAITAATLIFMPSQRVIMGVLSFIGLATLLMIPLDAVAKKIPPPAGMLCSAALFFLTRDINSGYLGFEGVRLLSLPKALYSLPGSFVFGFMPQDFFSSDYFSLFPWFFLFLFGYFLWRAVEKSQSVKNMLETKIPVLSFLGTKSLLVYMLHQPVIMLVLMIVFRQ